jgi:hypothetical protein
MQNARACVCYQGGKRLSLFVCLFGSVVLGGNDGCLIRVLLGLDLEGCGLRVFFLFFRILV